MSITDERAASAFANEELQAGIDPMLVGKAAKNVAVAQAVIALHQRRDIMLGPEVANSGQWEILLHIFVRQAASETITVAEVRRLALAARSTALRGIAVLTDAGVVQRTTDQADRRRSLIKLSPKGIRLMSAIIGGNPG